MYLHKEELWMEEGERMTVWQTMASVSTDELIDLINCSGRSYDQLMLQSRRGLPETFVAQTRFVFPQLAQLYFFLELIA